MGISSNFLLLYSLPFFLRIISATTNCSSTCGNQTIRFPFRLNQEASPACGYPGFGLGCSAQNQTILSLNNSGDFLVQEIDYSLQHIQVSDPGACLPSRLMRLNLSGSPFLVNLPINYTLYTCPKRFQTLGYLVISCLGDSRSSVLAILDGMNASLEVSRRCRKKGMLMAPPWPGGLKEDGVIELRWDQPECRVCEGGGGVCGFDGLNQVGCAFDPSKDQGGASDKVFKIIALSITIPAMICSLGVGIFLCTIDSRDSRVAQQVAVNPQSDPPAIEGLDQATIDSYTKVVLGESKRVPGPNKETCPICLSDFSPMETLRCIPECQHCFHSDCIDEWLRRNGSCPLCRKSPMPSPVHDSR